ncbi:MAG: porin family protein [Bacteroidota bacterium]
MPYDSFRSYGIPVRTGLLLAALLALSSSQLFAQQRLWMLRAGPTVTTFESDLEYEPRVGLAASFGVRQYLSVFFVQPELQLSIRSSSRVFDEPYPTDPLNPTDRVSRRRTDVTYVDLPVLLGIGLGGPVAPFIFGGPYGGMQFGATHSLTSISTGLATTRNAENINWFDYGFIAGLGGQAVILRQHIVFEARGLYGMAPVLDDGVNQYHRAAMLLVGIVF